MTTNDPEFQNGDRVIFRVPFGNADAYIKVGDIGIIRRLPRVTSLGFYSVVAKKQIWLVKASEMEKATLEQPSPTRQVSRFG